LSKRGFEVALFKYVGPLPEVEVHVAGNEIGVVEKGGSIVVPDELANQVAWSEHWQRADNESPAPAEPVAATTEPESTVEGDK
jgi:hypothetical protein